MKAQLILCRATVLFVGMLARGVAAQEAPPVLGVPARDVPVPTTVSPELQAVIARPVRPRVETPTTADGWRQWQREADAEAAERARTAAEKLEVALESTTVAGVPYFRITPKDVAPQNANRLIVHVHGGAYVFNAGLAATSEAVLLAAACRTPVLSIDYRMPPDHPFPAAPDDVLAVWQAVAAERDPATTAMAGTSAGAGLIMTTMLRLAELNGPKPAALFIGTPCADLTKTGDTMFLNAEVDNGPARYEGRLEACFKLYAAGRDLADPLISPIYGDLSGFPPTVLISGTRDLLLSATVRTHRKLRAAGVVAELHVFEGMSHGAYLGAFPAPESREALGEIAQFFDRHVKR